MALTVSVKRLPSSDDWSVDGQNARRARLTYVVDQTDEGALASPPEIVIEAQKGAVFQLGDQYSLGSFTDLDCYCTTIRAVRPHPEDLPRRWHVICEFGPPGGSDPGMLGEDDPLLWPTEYWVDWIEEQVPLEEARIVENLSHVGRAADSNGPVVNACGQEFTEGLMRTVYYPILNCQKAYETLDEIIALNLQYQGTTNNGTFFGAGTREAKYLLTESGRVQRLNGSSFYLGITRIQFKDSTWDRKVLNNGWNHFRKEGGEYITNASDQPKLFRNLVEDDPSAEETDEPDAPSSEPLNLALDGTLTATGSAATYLTYRDLAEVDYSGIGIGGGS